MPREPYKPLATFGKSIDLMPAFPPSERAAYAEYWDKPPVMLRAASGLMLADDAGIPLQFEDVTEALRFCRSEVPELVRS